MPVAGTANYRVALGAAPEHRNPLLAWLAWNPNGDLDSKVEVGHMVFRFERARNERFPSQAFLYVHTVTSLTPQGFRIDCPNARGPTSWLSNYPTRYRRSPMGAWLAWCSREVYRWGHELERARCTESLLDTLHPISVAAGGPVRPKRPPIRFTYEPDY